MLLIKIAGGLIVGTSIGAAFWVLCSLAERALRGVC